MDFSKRGLQTFSTMLTYWMQQISARETAFAGELIEHIKTYGGVNPYV